MVSFKPDPFSLTFLFRIFNNKLMHQHISVDGIVRYGKALVNFYDLFEDNRSRFVDPIRVQDGLFELWVQWLLLPPGIFQIWNMSGILLPLLLLVYPSLCDSYESGNIVRMFPILYAHG